MKSRVSFLFVCLPVVLLSLMGCRKELTPVTIDEVAGTPLPGQPTYCRIESIWEKPHAPDQRYILVLYDEYENPVAVTQPVVGTGRPYRTFKYDMWHRLRQYRGEYANGHYEFWHFYGYDLNGRIGVDTMYTFGLMGATGPVNWFERRISHYTYDTQGRIIKVVTTSTNSPGTTETNYAYDANGNLIYPPAFGIMYDNKMNYNRTNDIWQFLNRDYSRNNPFTAVSYNASGFPTEINTTRPVSFLNDFNLQRSQIGYSCRTAHW